MFSLVSLCFDLKPLQQNNSANTNYLLLIIIEIGHSNYSDFSAYTYFSSSVTEQNVTLFLYSFMPSLQLGYLTKLIVAEVFYDWLDSF